MKPDIRRELLLCAAVGVMLTAAFLISRDKPEGKENVTYTAVPRSPEWDDLRDAWLERHPHCAFKGCKETEELEVHHVQEFSRHRELELNWGNLETLCRSGPNHHLYCGHQGNYSEENPNCREDAKRGVLPSIGADRKKRHDAKFNPKGK